MTTAEIITIRRQSINQSINPLTCLQKHFSDFIQLMLNAHKDTDKGGEISELGGRDFSQYKNRGKITVIPSR